MIDVYSGLNNEAAKDCNDKIPVDMNRKNDLVSNERRMNEQALGAQSQS